MPSPTGNPVQTFCANEQAEIGDIQIVEVDINWYDDAIGGNLLNIQDVLTSGLYYAAQVVNGCESNIRLAVEVIVYQPILNTK